MTVKELIEMLKEYPENMEIYRSFGSGISLNSKKIKNIKHISDKKIILN